MEVRDAMTSTARPLESSQMARLVTTRYARLLGIDLPETVRSAHGPLPGDRGGDLRHWPTGEARHIVNGDEGPLKVRS